jgi:hypothetical protein
MSPAADRQYFVIALGWTALAAAVVLLVEFVSSFRFAAFWTFKWIISIVFMLSLFGAGVGLLNLGGDRRSARVSMTAFGSAFMIAAIILYCIWGYYQSAGGLPFKHYSGFLVVFVVSIGVAAACIGALSHQYLRFPSYGFGVVDCLYLFLLVSKYIFRSVPFRWDTFLGEIIVLLLGALLFLALYFGSEEQEAARMV